MDLLPARTTPDVAAVEALLERELDDLADLARHRQSSLPDALEPVMQLRRLLSHGGKRIRPLFVLLGREAADLDRSGCGQDDALLAAAAIELLHCFAIVHDDVMDESSTRRGAPTVHAAASAWHAEAGGTGSSTRFGESIAMLVGDLAHSEADRLAARLPDPMRRVWRDTVLELVDGQFHDVLGAATGERGLGAARRVARQKTGSYTVAGPLLLGAVAAGARPSTLASLDAYGRNAGEAFALSDDLLGVYGDPELTGKPAGDDLRWGKPTVLLAMAHDRLSGRAAATLRRAGSGRMTDAEVVLLQDAIRHAGVVDDVERLIGARIEDAIAALHHGELTTDGVDRLTAVAHDFVGRGQ